MAPTCHSVMCYASPERAMLRGKRLRQGRPGCPLRRTLRHHAKRCAADCVSHSLITPQGEPKDPRYSKNCERVWGAALGKISRGGRLGVSVQTCLPQISRAAEMTSPTSQLCRRERSDCSKESCRRIRDISTSPSNTVRSCKSSFTDVFQIAWSSAHRRFVSGPRNRAKESLSDEGSAF